MIRNEYSKQFTFHSEKFKGVFPKLLPSYFSLSEDTGDVNLSKCVSVAWQNPRPQWPLSHLAS